MHQTVPVRYILKALPYILLSGRIFALFLLLLFFPPKDACLSHSVPPLSRSRAAFGPRGLSHMGRRARGPGRART